MAFESIPQSWIAAGKFAVQSLFQRIKDNFDTLNGVLITQTTGKVLNPSFEVDSDDNGAPDNWDISLYPGGSQSLESTDPAHGGKALKFMHPGGSGNGGGYATSDYVEVTGGRNHFLRFIHWATAAGMRNQAVVKYYDRDQIYVSSSTLYDSTSNPTSAQDLTVSFTTPASARYLKLELHGGVEDTDAAGSAYFDNVRVLNDDTMQNGRGLMNVLAGSTEIARNLTERVTGEVTATKLKEITTHVGGTIRIEWLQKKDDNGGGTNPKAYVHRNGTLISGETHEITDHNYWIAMSRDISGWSPGDLVQIYGKDNQSNDHARVKNMYIKTSNMAGDGIYYGFSGCGTPNEEY